MSEFLSIVVPVYNEEKNIPLLIEQLDKVVMDLGREVEIIFIDDRSRDNSFDELKKIKEARGDKIRIVRFKKNFGQTAAIAAGIDLARGDIIITMDADLQNDPADIPVLLSEIDKGYDVVSGWRRNRKDPLFTRKFPSYFANKIISWYTGVKLRDYGCTLKAYRKKFAKDINLYGELHRFIPALMSWGGARITEVSVKHHPRKFGKSKYGISRTVNVILDLVTVKFLLSSAKGPMQIFGRFGILFVMLGFFSGVATLGMRVAAGVNMTGNPLLYLTIFFIIIGLQFISMGLLGELNMRIYHRSHGKKIYVVEDVL